MEPMAMLNNQMTSCCIVSDPEGETRGLQTGRSKISIYILYIYRHGLSEKMVTTKKTMRVRNLIFLRKLPI